MPYVALLCAMFLWSSSVIAGKSALAHYAITEVVLGRFICAAAVLWLLVLGFRHEFRLNRLSKRPLIMGLLDPGLVSLLLIWGLSQTAAVNTAVFWALMPLLMPILGRVVLKERLQPVVMVGAVIAVGGTFLLVSANLSSGEGSLFGDFLAIAAVLCACANSLIARRVAQVAGAPLESQPEHLAPAWATDPRPEGLTYGFRAFGFAPPVALSVPLPQPV